MYLRSSPPSMEGTTEETTNYKNGTMVKKTLVIVIIECNFRGLLINSGNNFK